MLCVCHTTPTQMLFACLSSGWATSTGRLLGPKVGNSIKCLSQGHSDALPHRELNQGFATFRLLARCSTIRATPPQLLSCHEDIHGQDIFPKCFLWNFSIQELNGPIPMMVEWINEHNYLLFTMPSFYRLVFVFFRLFERLILKKKLIITLQYNPSGILSEINC